MSKKKLPDPEKIMQDTIELLEISTNNIRNEMEKNPLDESLRKGLADNVRALAQLTKEIRIWKKENIQKWISKTKREKTQIAANFISKLPSGYFKEAMEIIMKDHPSVRMNKKWKEEAQRRQMSTK